MHVQTLQLKIQFCIERAEEARRDDERQRWLQAADSWQKAIEYRRTAPDQIPDWTSLKIAAAGDCVDLSLPQTQSS